MTEKIHFIAVGGSVMHNLAIALKKEGNIITGSDDEFFDPSLSRLQKYGILPEEKGWFPEKITTDLDAVIVGMHAKKDNPELLKAQEMGLPVYSFPDFVFEKCKDKQRIVIAGSHGKTTITAMVMHVLKYFDRKFDYLVGAQLEGFETMVRLTDDAPIVIIEGDEYLTSPLDPTPKFLKYKHHIALMTGIAWDHFNVYPTFDEYVNQFEKLAESTPKAGTLIYNEEGPLVSMICNNQEDKDMLRFPYNTPPYTIKDGKSYLQTKEDEVPLKIFGEHNLNNLAGAKLILERLCIQEKEFYEAIQSFTGAGKRLEIVAEKNNTTIYRDFAHSPSKVQATCEAVKKQFKDRELVACLELHTYSSLNKSFIHEYKDKLKTADTAVIYLDPASFEAKKLNPLTDIDIYNAFGRKDIQLFKSRDALEDFLSGQNWDRKNLLLMSSGSFDKLDLSQLTDKILN